ncbi:uncharacterized protein LOC133824757 [Humulus lupulus]|uniref:uncharacterized protein LOC133824757 n=1 Tax=Humulus lupulus TaxID=3486 RepID=UPI002B4113FD|nr:uncharacterized protein LOC133824757 [Humulus lupulus]
MKLFTPLNLLYDDGYEYEPFVNDDPVAYFGDDNERVEGCSSSDDNSKDRLSKLPVVQMLCEVALDANNHLYPVAFGIVDSENHDSWKYFMSKLKEAIGEVEDMAFVSDRKSKFHAHFKKIKLKDPAIAQYLEGMGFDKLSRAYFLGNRYNIMTSNYTESFNNRTRDARIFPITTFVEFIHFTLQSCFCDRRETSEKTTTTLGPTYEKNLVDMAEKDRFLIPYAIGRHAFHVLDGELNGEVDLLNKTCTCSVF